MTNIPDSLRDAIYRATVERGWTAHYLEQKCLGSPSWQHIDDYLTGRKSMTSDKVCRLLKALGITITTEK